ncbi:MAG: corrinoid protein-associated methyltransferase CpaM [Planctomycetaceae bacterium]
MSTYILMRILESSPCRYDRGIRLLTGGRLDRAYDRLAGHIHRGDRVIDLGCGTGALTMRAAQQGADVKAIDINPHMLEIARRRAAEQQLDGHIEFAEMGVAELETELTSTYDAVTSGLCLSELSDDELRFALSQVQRILKPGGRLLIADEVKPGGKVRRLLQSLIRVPLALLTYVLTGRTSRPLEDLPKQLQQAELSLLSCRRNWLRDFVQLVAEKRREGE